jgi:hypothetical protein
MALTTEQLTALRDYINTIPEWSALPNDSSSALFIAQQMDAAASPKFIVWRTMTSQDEIMLNGFDWVRVDNLSVGKARIWEWLFSNDARAINPSKVNVRAGIDEAWKGTSADLAVRAAVYAHCKRAATIAEKVLATGQGTTENPATMGFEGQLSYADVQAARSL